MKKLLTCISACAFAVSAFAADTASSGVYVRGDIGASFGKAVGGKYSTGTLATKPVYNLGVGYKFDDNFRGDVNFQYRKSSLKNVNSKVTNKTVFFNGYYDLKNDTIFTPYVTAGLGLSSNTFYSKINTNIVNGSAKGHMVYNAGLGTKIGVYKNVDLDVSYRYSDLGRVAKNSARWRTHEIMTGVSYTF